MNEENLKSEEMVDLAKQVEQIKPIDSIVQKNDFPEPSSRLQSIMAKYRKEQHLPPADVVSKENPLAKVKVKNEVKTRTFDDLKPEEQQIVAKKIQSIDYLASGDILQFGGTRESPITKNAEIIISKYSASELGELSEPMTDLVATLKSNSPNSITQKISDPKDKDWGIFSSLHEIFSLKKYKKKMYKALAQHDTILKNIKAIEVELKKQQISLRKDIEAYEQMGKSTYDQIGIFELDCIALDLMIEDAEAKLAKYTQKDSLDLQELNEANQLNSAIERMNRRKYLLQNIRVSTVQSIPQLAVLILGDEIICEKIDEVEELVLPMWEWQYAIAIGAIKQKEALSIQKTIRGITSKLIKGNAKMLHDNMIAAQEELYAAAIAVEDLVIVQDYIDDMVTKVSETRKLAAQKCVEGVKTMQQIEQKNWDLMSQNLS